MCDCNEVLEVLRQIERGEMSLTCLVEDRGYCGETVPFRAGNGWTFWIFNDCDRFDYIDRVELPDGKYVDYEVVYIPNQKVEKEIWGFNKGNRYHAENWVTWWHVERSRHVLKCAICKADESYEMVEGVTTTVDVNKKMITFAEKHYACNPIYGEDVMSD